MCRCSPVHPPTLLLQLLTSMYINVVGHLPFLFHFNVAGHIPFLSRSADWDIVQNGEWSERINSPFASMHIVIAITGPGQCPGLYHCIA